MGTEILPDSEKECWCLTTMSRSREQSLDWDDIANSCWCVDRGARIQLGSVPDYVCDGPYPLFDDPNGPQCTALRSKVPTCQRLIQSCYNYNSRLTCVPAVAYCYSQLMGPVQRKSRLFRSTPCCLTQTLTLRDRCQPI